MRSKKTYQAGQLLERTMYGFTDEEIKDYFLILSIHKNYSHKLYTCYDICHGRTIDLHLTEDVNTQYEVV